MSSPKINAISDKTRYNNNLGKKKNTHRIRFVVKYKDTTVFVGIACFNPGS